RTSRTKFMITKSSTIHTPPPATQRPQLVGIERGVVVVLMALLCPVPGHAQPTLAKLRAVPFTDVQVEDSFWRPRQETNRLATIPVNFAQLEKSGNIRNLELAGEHATNGFSGPVFMDSDIYKALEAASYSLATHPDPVLTRQMDAIIAKLAKAQQPDGYLNTY